MMLGPAKRREIAPRDRDLPERLPLVIGTCRQGAFRRSVAVWVGKDGPVSVRSLADLEQRVRHWNGDYPDASAWLRAEKNAAEEAQRQVREMEARAKALEERALAQQVASARLRLQKELGRYLVCVSGDAGDLNGVLDRQIKRDTATAHRLRKCLERLGGWPEWDEEMCRRIESYCARLSENQVQARLLGKEIDAALDDPRWLAR